MIAAGVLAVGAASCTQAEKGEKEMQTAELNLTAGWDKVFPQSDKVNHSKRFIHS